MSIKINHLSYSYLIKSPHRVDALKDVSFSLEDHFFSAIIGETGSGKSTLIQTLNALLIPQEGSVEVDRFVITNKKKQNKNIKELRKHISLVFQFPEYQLFEETVLKDVAFGVKNYGASKEEAEEAAKKALSSVGIDELYYDRSPFELSGGEKRRVAIAGILALNPDILVLDEPTAGLDPQGSEIILNLIQKLYDSGKSILLVTHDMNLVLKYCSSAYVLYQGKLVLQGKPYEIFDAFNDSMAIDMPPLYKIAKELKERGLNIDLSKIRTINDLVNQIKGEINHE